MITITKYVNPTLDNFSLSVEYYTTDVYGRYNEYHNSFHVDTASVIYNLRNTIDFQAPELAEPEVEQYSGDITDNNNKLPQVDPDFLSKVLNSIMNRPTN